MDRKAVIADDDDSIRRLVKASLERQGFTVAAAANGAEALQMILADPPSLVIMDVDMPGMNGLEALAELRKTMPSDTLPVIMLSAKDHPADADRAYDAGANLYLEKPFRPGVFQHAVDSVLDETEAEPITLSGC